MGVGVGVGETWSRGDDLGKAPVGEDGGWRQEAPGSRSGRAGPMASLRDPQCVLTSREPLKHAEGEGTLG